MLRWFLVAAALVAAAPGPDAVAAARPAGPDAAVAGHAALDRGEYLRAVAIFRAGALTSDGRVADEHVFQSWEQYLPMVTGELPVGGLRPPAAQAVPADPVMLAALRDAEPRDALAEIVRRARDTRVVILNEAHTSPRDRAFALMVARALRPLGYRILAAEAFFDDDTDGPMTPVGQLRRDRFVRLGTGTYTRDPVFAGFVREALRLGYEPAAYEIRGDQERPTTTHADAVAVREAAQADNLQALLRARPGAKLLVYVGHGHVAEEPVLRDGFRAPWMAARLKRLTGIDPLTIDQTTLTDTDPDWARAYAAASARVARPSVLFSGDRPLVVGQYAGAVDLQVVHPRRAYRDGRPAWFAALGGRPVAIPAALLPARGERLVQAFAAAAPADAVPLDQVLVRAGAPAPSLMLPAGPYRLAVQDP